MALINTAHNHAAYIGATTVEAIYVGSTMVWGGVVSYTTMRALSADPTDRFTLTGSGAAGSFTAVETDARDNGGTVIGSNTHGVMWVRDGVYNTAEAPMQLNWFERTKNGPLVVEGADMSPAIERIVAASCPEPGDLPFPCTRDTVGLWVFHDNLDEYGEQTFVPENFYLEAPFPVRLSTLHLPYGHANLSIVGPITLQRGVILGRATEVDHYVPRGKLFGFGTGPFHLESAHDGLASTEQLLLPATENALTLNVISAADGTTLRIADGLNLDRLVVEKSGFSQNPLRVVVQPQSLLPITFEPNTPWRKVMDVPGFPGLIDGDELVFDNLLSRSVFEARVPPAGGITEDTAGYWTFEDTLDEAGAATLDTVTPARRIWFDNWDAASLPIMSFWYRTTAPLTATALLEPAEGAPGVPADTVAISWTVTANDNWQQADLDISAALAGNPAGTRVRAVEINASGAGYYRLAGWSE